MQFHSLSELIITFQDLDGLSSCAPSQCGSEPGPEWIVAYPPGAKPLVIMVADPCKSAWLPENTHQDYTVATSQKGKVIITSPGLGLSKYVARLQELCFQSASDDESKC